MLGAVLAPHALAPRATDPPAVARIRRRLRFVYGIPPTAPHRHPIAELVLTVLSQSTNDRNRDVAYLRLREFLPTWEQVRDAPVAEVERAIRPGGISKVKSVACRRSCARSPPTRQTPPHELSLDWLAAAPVGEGRDYLVGLPGVGRKTAACVLLFALGKREVPVDTHVSRVGIRLGLLPAGAPFEVLHDRMLALTPRGGARAARQPPAPRQAHLPGAAVPAASCARSEPIVLPSSLRAMRDPGRALPA